jgi:predicted HD phosphohydrolase
MIYDFDALINLLENLKGIESREDYHPEKDTYNHSLQIFHHAIRESDDLDLILAAMMHDVGKAVNKIGHENIAVDMLQGLLSEKSLWLIENHMRIWYLIEGKMIRLQKVKDLVSNKWFPDLVLLARWDKMSRKSNFQINYDRDKIKAKLTDAFVKKENKEIK